MEEARELRGEATGPEEEEVEEAATIVITTRGAPAHSSHGVTPCWLGARHLGASTILEEGVRGGVGAVWEG